MSIFTLFSFSVLVVLLNACSVRSNYLNSDYIIDEFFRADVAVGGVYLVGGRESYDLPLDILFTDFELGFNVEKQLGIRNTILFRLICELHGSEDWAFSVLERLRSSYDIENEVISRRETFSVKVIGVESGDHFHIDGISGLIRRYDLGIDSEKNYWGLIEVEDRTFGRASGGVWVVKCNLTSESGLIAIRMAIY